MQSTISGHFCIFLLVSLLIRDCGDGSELWVVTTEFENGAEGYVTEKGQKKFETNLPTRHS